MEQIEYIRENVLEAKNYILSKCPGRPKTALILGSGMADALPDLENPIVLEYQSIPHFPGPAVSGHRGQLVCGVLDGNPLLAMLGRFHYYEGYTMRGVTFPIRVLAALGVETLVITNAAGGLNRRYRPGDFMIVNNHINLMGDNPLIGPNDESLGPRFVDLSDAYNPGLLDIAGKTARRLRVNRHQGVLAGVSGPSYETAAEIKFLTQIGADAVTMSAIPEVIVARHTGINVLAISVITNIAGQPKKLTHDEVLAVAAGSTGKLKEWLREILMEIEAVSSEER